MKRTSALLLSICLASVMFTACGNNKESQNGNDSSPSASSAASSESNGDASTKPLITLKVSAVDIQGISPGIQSDPVMEEIKKKLNIQLDITQVQGTDWNTKLAALTATGDLPDLFYVPGPDQMKILKDANAVLDATELVQSHGPNLVNNPEINKAVQYSEKYYGDGKLYFIPFEAGARLAPSWTFGVVAPQLRWDLYKKMGYPAINSYDDLLTVLADMQKQFPTAASGKKAYAVSLFSEWGDWPFLCGQFLYGVNPIVNNMSADISDPSKLLPDLTDKDSTYWKVVKWYNKAYQMGILDPDGVVQKFDGMSAKQNAGELYYVTPGWLQSNFAGNPDEGFAAPATLVQDGKFNAGSFSSTGNRMYAISKDTKHADRVMDLINYLYSIEGARLIQNGVEGQTWDYVDGVAQFKPEIEQEVLKGGSDLAWYQKTGVMLYSQFVGLDPTYVDPANNQPINIQNSQAFIQKRSQSNQVFQDYVKHYNLKSPSDPFYNIQYNSMDNAIGGAMPMLPEDIKMINDQITSYKNQAIFKTVIAKNDEDFAKLQDEFIKKVQDMGIQKVYDWTVQNWNQVYGEVSQMGK